MDDVLIVGKLDDGELRKAIDSLVNDVANKSTQMALTFEQAMDKMTNAMKNFAISQKVSVDLMQEAWKKMSQSFDAMLKAQSSGAGSGGGHGGGRPRYDDGTVGQLEESIRLEKQRRKEMYLGTEELAKQNIKLEEQKATLKSETTVHRSLNDVLKMQEKSVDDVAKKMKALKNVSIDPNNTIEVKKLGDEYQRLKRLQAQLLGQSIQQTKSNNYLAQSFGYIRNRIVYALTLGAITNFTKQVYEIRGQYELLERSLGVLINSFERGSKIFQELNAMSIESPFTLMELAGAAKQLTAYNFSAKEVVDTTRRLADLSAALGVPMERLTYNLGQIRAQTVLTARDARDFANAGLPVVKLLSDYYTELEGKVVSTGDVYDRMSKKMVSYTDVMTVLNKATDEGGKFFDFQAKQAETLRVQMANLTLAYNNMLNEVGKANQGLLTTPVKGLKVLFQNWESIARVIKNLGLSFIFLKATQLGMMPAFGALNAHFVSTARLATTLRGIVVSLGSAFKALFLNPWTWVFAGIFAITDLIGQSKRAREEVAELNQEIKKGAGEASSSNIEYLTNKGNQATRDAAKEGKLTAEQGEKAWQSLEEQINTSAISANNLLGELWQIEDVNERVAKGFDYVESIQKSQAALQDLKDNTIEVTQDDGWFGIFREGLVSDLKDYKDLLDEATKNGIVNWNAIHISSEFKEFQKELDTTALSITHFLDVHKIEDPEQIREILERIKMQIKMQNPEIKGELAQLFDVELDKRMFEWTNGSVDENYSLWNTFMERLKHNASAAFQGITSDIYDENTKLSKEQQKAVDDNLKYFQDTMPWYYNAVKDMVADASKLKIQIGMTFSTQLLTNFQEEVNKRIKAAKEKFPLIDFGNASFLPNQNEDLPEWEKRQQDAIASLRKQNKTYSKDNTEWSKGIIKANDEEIEQRTALLELFHLTAEAAKKDKKERTSTEDVLGKALQNEVEIITNIQKRYKEYQKMGVDAQTAITKATDEYARTLASTNATLNQFGIKTTKSGTELANMDLRDLRSYYEGLLAMAAGLGNAKGIEVLEKAIANLNIEITKVDYKKITDGLNNELGKLKDEYELGIELDANPELGGIFADMMGISQEELEQMPRDFEGVVTRLQQIINDKLGAGKFNLMENLNKGAFEAWLGKNNQGDVKNDELSKSLNAIVEYANKVRLDESKNQIEEWNKLLEKYSEYESKVTQIQKEAEKQRETARKAGATKEVFDAINRWEKQELASLSFEEFQKSPEWIVATGDLANMSKSAIGMLIAELEKYKKSAKNLSPKQIKEMNRALSKLYKEQRKGNPFAAIANVIDEAKNNMSAFDEEIEKVNEDIAKTEVAIAQATLKGEDTSKLQSRLKNLRETWKKLREEQEAAGKIDATTMVGAINETISAVSAAVGVFNDLAKAISGVNENDIDKTFAILDKAGQGALIGAQFGGYGAAIGAAAGLATGLIQTLANAGNEKITRQVEDSELAVKRLQNSYNDLQHAVEQAYGAMEIGARKAMVANRELELEELQRQLQLERSRKSKNRDNGRIADLEGQIIDLKNELVDMRAEITNSFLGISSVSDAITSMMDAIVDALRNGEDAMAKVNDSVDDMIANMIKQVFSAKIVGPMIEDIWNKVDEDIQARGKKWADEYASWKAQYDSISTSTNDTGQGYFFLKKGNEYKATESGFERTWLTLGEKWEEITYEQWKKMMEDNMKNAEGELKKATTPTMDDVRNYAGMLRGVSPELEAYMDDLENILREMGLIKDTTSEKALSSLQQGIQGVTEDTAGAIEAITSGMSQQIYKQSDLLTQIRDAVIGMDVDVSVGVMSQILLQLQSSYQTQNAIRSIMEGWSSANGMSVRVEMI